MVVAAAANHSLDKGGSKQLLSVGGRRLPLSRQKFHEFADRLTGDPGQDVAEILKGVDLVPLAGGDQAEEDRGGRPAGIGSAEEPVFSSHSDSPQGVLTGVVIDGQVAVADVDAQGVVLVQGVGDRLAQPRLARREIETCLLQAACTRGKTRLCPSRES